MAIVLYPMARMPAPWGALTWFFLKVGMTLLALLWVFRLVETPGRPFPLGRVVTVLLSLARSSATSTTATSTCSSSSWWSPP